GSLGRLAGRPQPGVDRLFARSPDVRLAGPGELLLLADPAGAEANVHDGQGGRFHARAGRPCVLTPARPDHGGDARSGRAARAARLFRLVEALAGGAPGRPRSCGTLDRALPRPRSGIPERTSAAPVPPGHADRVHRRELRGPGRTRLSDRLGGRAPPGRRGSAPAPPGPPPHPRAAAWARAPVALGRRAAARAVPL